jgi:phage recombination protein Bet
MTTTIAKMQPTINQQPVKASALTVLAARLQADPEKLLHTLKSTVFKGASNEEVMALTVVANQYGLNPFTKELYAFPAKGGGIAPMVSVDGWIRIVNDQPQFDGVEFEYVDTEDGKPYSCTASIYRKDRGRPTRVTEFFAECSRNTDPWNKSPRRMLRHKALMQCSRVAFGFSGIYDEDEVKDVRVNVSEPRFDAPMTVPANDLLDDLDEIPMGDPISVVPVPEPKKAAQVTKSGIKVVPANQFEEQDIDWEKGENR